MKNRLNRRSAQSDDTANPMDGVANLADVMIVLAVGIMLALIINWNVDVGATAYIDPSAQTAPNNALALEDGNMEEVTDTGEEVNSDEMEKLGSVYYDEASGKYYIIVD